LIALQGHCYAATHRAQRYLAANVISHGRLVGQLELETFPLQYLIDDDDDPNFNDNDVATATATTTSARSAVVFDERVRPSSGRVTRRANIEDTVKWNAIVDC